MSGRGTSSRGPTTRSQNWKKKSAASLSQRRSDRDVVTKRDLHGGKISPRTNPPDVTYQPWNVVTLVHAFTNTLELSVSGVLTLMRKQLDPTNRGFNQVQTGDGRFVIQLKLYSVQVWNLTGKTVSLSVSDFTESESASGGRDQLCGIVDTGSQTHTPCIGYLLPSSHRQHVLRTDDKQGTDVLFHIGAGSSDQCMVYIRVAYRFDGPVKPPKLLLPIDSIGEKIDDLTNQSARSTRKIIGIDKILTRLKEISENTYAARPSTIKKVIKGVEYTALAVSALAAANEEDSSFCDISNYLEELELEEAD